MRSTLSKSALFFLYGLAAAVPSPSSNTGVSRRQDNAQPGSSTPADSNQGPKSCNTADNRQCWVEGFDIKTAYEESIPDTGVTREVGQRVYSEGLRCANKLDSMTWFSPSTPLSKLKMA